MLSSLRINNVVLIEKLEILFHQGLCTLTGETGAGKSILLDSRRLATGARADSGLVRKDADKASVTAIFEVTPNHIVKKFYKTMISISIKRSCCAVLSQRMEKAVLLSMTQPISAGLLKTIGHLLLEVSRPI